MGGKVALIEFKIVLESAPATLFCFPSICLTSVVNSEIYAKWHCCLEDHGSVALANANVNGL